jgi:type IV secretion system protein VirB11
MLNKLAPITTGIEGLTHYCAPLAPWLNAPDVSDIHINIPGEIIVMNGQGKQFIDVPELTKKHLDWLCRLIANQQSQVVSNEHPLLSASLPQGHRIQVAMSPVAATSREGAPMLSFRKQVIPDMNLDQLIDEGILAHTKPHFVPFFKDSPRILNEEDEELTHLFAENRYAEFLKAAILMEKNIIISGSTGSGKTTLLNACLKEISSHQRILTLEDTRELHLDKKNHPDHGHFLISKGNQGTAKVTMADLVEMCLRYLPDRIIFGEMRGAEALDFMNASLTGHTGSMVSLHATNPSAVFLRLSNMIQSNPHVQLSRADLLSDLNFVVDVVVQMKRIEEPEGYKRIVTEIYSAFNTGARGVR